MVLLSPLKGFIMRNDDLVQGFDSSVNDSLKIVLQECNDIKEGILLHLIGYIDTYNSSFFQKISQIRHFCSRGYAFRISYRK